jgi:cytochrome c556
MMFSRLTLGVLAFAAAASAALAHSGVKNAAVMARMTLMTDVADDMKVLGGMVKGTTPFDASIVEAKGNSLALHASKIAPMFEDQARDPKSEALDSIWTDWDGFVADADAMEAAAIAVAQVKSADGLATAFSDLGKSCTACHQDYRIKK